MQLEIYRGASVITTIEVGEEAIYKEGLMSDHQIEIPDVVSLMPLDLQLGDYIIYKGVVFKINTVPDVLIEHDYTYRIIFEGPKFTWHDKLFMDEGSNEFPYYGNAYQLMELLILNVNEIDPGWSLGQIEATTERLLQFTGGEKGLFCYDALKQIAEEFKLEYEINGKAISLVKKVGRDTGLSFEYGMGNGLFDMKRTYVNEKNVVTKAYGFGGTKNLPEGYGKPRLTYDPGYASHNIDLYRTKEGKYVNDEIYPHREALVTAVTFGADVYTVTDPTLDFDINACLLKNVTAKISFITGELSGETFEITKYNATTKIITYKGFTNTNNVELPNAAFQAKVGDKYTLLDIDMPASYVTAAQSQLRSETEAYVLENSAPQLEYQGTADPLHMKQNSIDLKPGDRVNFKDTNMGFNNSIRITEISYPITFPELLTNDTRINITVANYITYTSQQRVKADILQVKNEVQTVDIRRAENARRNSANLFNLRDLVIDPTTEKYYTGKIAAGSIETLYLAIGAKATNYSLKNISFNTNAGGNPNAFTATVGQLVHYDVKIEGVGFVWEMQPFTTTSLISGNTYYLYAKVSRTSLVGSWVVSTNIIPVESVAGFWHFQAGVLFSVKDGRRDYELTKGMSFIIGDQITAGVLKSLDGQNYFNLTDGKFNLGDANNGIDWNVSTPNRLTIRGGLTQNSGGISAPITLFRGPYGNTTTYYKGDSVTYNGSTWAYIYPTPIFNVIPAEGIYWTVQAQKGSDGANGTSGNSVEIQYSVNGTTSWHNDFTAGDVFARQRVGTGSPWSAAFRIVGEQGSPGVDGKYTDYQFSKNTSLTTGPTTGWQDNPPATAVGEYLWMRTGEFNANGSQIGSWSAAVRLSGANGIDGLNGSNGTPGAPGANGLTPYFHVAYADSADGSVNFNQSGGKYIGTYVDNSPADSGDYHTYQWVLIKGVDGANGTNGIPGVNGADGRTSYLHIKYSNDGGASFTGSAGEESGKYLGQYVDFVLEDSNNPAAYTWSLIKGADGANGTNGTNGTNGQYTDIRYAKSGSNTVPPSLEGSNPVPPGWSVKLPEITTGEYVWMTSGQKLDYYTMLGTWSPPTRLTGVNGSAGEAGSQGPFILGRGNYDNTKTYVGTIQRLEVVKYLGSWYITRSDAGNVTGVLPTDTSKWNAFGAQFESVATDILFATLAFIENLGVRNLKTRDTGRRMEIIGDTNSQTFYDSSGNDLLSIKDDVSSFEDDDVNHTSRKLAGMEFKKRYSSNPGNPDIVNLSGNGIYSNTGDAAAIHNHASSDLAFGSIIGYVRRLKTLVNGQVQAAIVGLSTTANSFGGFFKHMTGGTALRVDGTTELNGSIKSEGQTGITKRIAYSYGSTTYHIEVVNGLIVENGTGA